MRRLIRNTPRLSIGMPVFNGERYLKESIQTLLDQTYEDFELLISDNASTDSTQDICQDFAKLDKRIRYMRNPTNLGAAANHNRLIEEARGEFFKLASDDDKHAPEFLRRCIEALDHDQEAVLCHSKTIEIDQFGKTIKTDEHISKMGSAYPHVRIGDLIALSHHYQVFGVIRLEPLKKTPLFGTFFKTDVVLLCRLALLGRFYEVPEELFFKRYHPRQSVILAMKPELYCHWLDPNLEGKRLYPRARLLMEYLKAISDSPLSLKNRILCYLTLMARLRGYSANAWHRFKTQSIDNKAAKPRNWDLR